MQTITTTTAPAASPEAQASAEAHAVAATVAATAKREAAEAKRAARAAASEAKPAKPAKRAAKPEAVAKPATAAKPAKRDAAAAEAKRDAAFKARTEARTLAAQSVKAYYDGASLPFKAAADTFSPINPKREPKRATPRQSALLASMLVTGTFKRDGTFTRGAFVIDGRNVQPESGCLSDMLNRVVTYVSGPITGANQRDAVFKLNVKAAIAEITAQLPASPLRTAALKRAEAILSGKPA